MKSQPKHIHLLTQSATKAFYQVLKKAILTQAITFQFYIELQFPKMIGFKFNAINATNNPK